MSENYMTVTEYIASLGSQWDEQEQFGAPIEGEK